MSKWSCRKLSPAHSAPEKASTGSEQSAEEMGAGGKGVWGLQPNFGEEPLEGKGSLESVIGTQKPALGYAEDCPCQ